MPGPAFVEGETVALHTVTPEDVEFLEAVINDHRVRSSLMADEPIHRHQEEEWVESIGEDDGVHLLIAVEDGDEVEPVGTIGLKPPNQTWGTAEVGYMVAPEHWANGYCTEAVALLVEYAFVERRLEKVYATVYDGNEGSTRVLEKNGFTREGRHRSEAFVDGERVDVLRYGLLAEEWEA